MFLTLEIIFALVEKYTHYDSCDYASEYGEPGYSNEDVSGILFANWNNVPKHIANGLERRGYELEWSDEWVEHDGKAYRTQPDSYGWKPSYILSEDCEIVTRDEIEENESEREWYFTEHLANHAARADSFELDLSANGFVEVSQDESGFHSGQNGNPAAMLDAAQKIDENALYVFQIDGVGQFDISFSLWKRDPESEIDSSEITSATSGYLVCALWTGTDESDESGGAPLDANYSIDEISDESKEAARVVVREFVTENPELYRAAVIDNPRGYDSERFGHDLWLTRNGHGTGFWDRKELDVEFMHHGQWRNVGACLTEMSKRLGETYVYISDAGEIEVEK